MSRLIVGWNQPAHAGRSPFAPLFALLAGAAALGCNPPPPAAPPKAPEVDVSPAVQEEVTDYEIFTGRVQAEQSVDLRAQVTGYLLAKPLPPEGTDVKDGEVVFKIDPSVYEATLAQAKAQTSQAESRVRTAQDVYNRDLASPIATPAATQTQDLDTLKEAQAALEAAQAMQQAAQLSVNFTDIKAPFAGRISRRNVDPGNLVQANQTSLATVVQLDPIYAYFDVDERTVLHLGDLAQRGKIPESAFKGVGLDVQLALANESGFTYSADDEKQDTARKRGRPRHPGKIKIIDNQEDPQTGTLREWGEFSNPDPKLLSPGMFGRVRLPIGPPHAAVLVAEAALVTDQGRKLVYVAGPPDENGECTTTAQYVTTGAYQNGLREVESGLQAGDKVVLNGLQRVRDKGKVKVRNVVEMPRAEEDGGR